jgi:hypothetical protein
VDRIALALYTSRVKGRALDLAREADDLAIAIHEAGPVDEAMLIRRAQVLDGKVEVHRDDLRILRHPLLVGRWCVAVGCWLLRVARALR